MVYQVLYASGGQKIEMVRKKRREWKVKVDEILERRIRRRCKNMKIQYLLTSLLQAYDRGIVEVPEPCVPAAIVSVTGIKEIDDQPFPS